MQLETKKIIWCCNVAFCKHGKLQEELEMHPSRRRISNGVLVVDKPPTYLDGTPTKEPNTNDYVGEANNDTNDVESINEGNLYKQSNIPRRKLYKSLYQVYWWTRSKV